MYKRQELDGVRVLAREGRELLEEGHAAPEAAAHARAVVAGREARQGRAGVGREEVVAVDEEEGTIRAAHFKNVIDEDGKACDPVTGEVIPCDGSYKPTANATFEGRTAKELSVKILEEEEGKGTVTMLVHANYLGREFQRAEQCCLLYTSDAADD